MTVTEEHHAHPSENQMMRAFLSQMTRELHAIKNCLNKGAVLIDEWKYEPSATVIQPLRDWDGPVIIQTIVAAFPSNATSAFINLGTPGRTIPLANPDAQAQQSIDAQGAVTNPSTGGTIAQVPVGSLPAGTYSIMVYTYLDGTPAITDDDNMALHVGLTSVGHLNQPGTADNQTSTGPFILAVNGNQTISVVAITTVSDGATYHAQIVATPWAGTSQQANQTVVNLQGMNIQLGQDDTPRNLQISPAGPAYINFIGYADTKQIDVMP
jgi:hypothetical protein